MYKFTYNFTTTSSHCIWLNASAMKSTLHNTCRNGSNDSRTMIKKSPWPSWPELDLTICHRATGSDLISERVRSHFTVLTHEPVSPPDTLKHRQPSCIQTSTLVSFISLCFSCWLLTFHRRLLMHSRSDYIYDRALKHYPCRCSTVARI